VSNHNEIPKYRYRKWIERKLDSMSKEDLVTILKYIEEKFKTN
jgi:hypothetical protein